jgi:hypothetical protein
MLPIGQKLLIGKMLLIGPVLGICASAHDISPCLKVQLVLELKGRKPSTKVIQIFPCSRSRWFTLPFNEHLTHSPGQPR